MNSLDLFSVRALMQAPQQIHSTMDLAALPGKLFSAVKTLVSGAVFIMDHLDVTTGVVIELTSVGYAPESMKERILELIPTHPVVPGCKAAREELFVYSDRITQVSDATLHFVHLNFVIK